jgi:hypothetical protein
MYDVIIVGLGRRVQALRDMCSSWLEDGAYR